MVLGRRSSDYSGIEIINADTMFKNNYRPGPRLCPAPPPPLPHPAGQDARAPGLEFKRWDQRGAHAAIYGYFSADAHLYYRAIFSLLRLHVLVDGPREPTSKRPGPGLRAPSATGRFFNAVEAVAEARGFRFGALGRRPDLGALRWATHRAGAAAAGAVPFEVLAPFPFAQEIRLLHDGRSIAVDGRESLRAPAAGPGRYRVEVFLKERSPLGADIPWIVSNPIYLRKD